MENYSDFKCPYIDKKEIWHIAEIFRKDYWPEGTLPIDIEKIVEQRLKLTIEPKTGLLSEQDIDAYLRVDLTGIVVDEKTYMDERFANRLRFSYAHEIGHLKLHKEIYSQFSIQSPDEWMKFVLTIPTSEYGHFEYQANEFAGRVLVPTEQLKSDLEASLKILEENKLLDYLTEDPTAVLSRISSTLCKPFGVSYKVIEIRVQREELWPPKIEYIDGVGVKLLE